MLALLLEANEVNAYCLIIRRYINKIARATVVCFSGRVVEVLFVQAFASPSTTYN